MHIHVEARDQPSMLFFRIKNKAKTVPLTGWGLRLLQCMRQIQQALDSISLTPGLGFIEMRRRTQHFPWVLDIQLTTSYLWFRDLAY